MQNEELRMQNGMALPALVCNLHSSFCIFFSVPLCLCGEFASQSMARAPLSSAATSVTSSMPAPATTNIRLRWSCATAPAAT